MKSRFYDLKCVCDVQLRNGVLEKLDERIF